MTAPDRCPDRLDDDDVATVGLHVIRASVGGEALV
jgi:hypothetical protein